MSNYFKRSIIAEETKSGYTIDSPFTAIIKMESATGMGIKITISAPTLNVAKEELKLVISFADDMHILDYITEQYQQFQFSKDISCGIFHGEQLICFGSSGSTSVKRNDFIQLFLKKKLFSYASTKERVLENVYDDEKIADLNYYDNRPIREFLNDEKHQIDKHAETERNSSTEQKTDSAKQETFSNEANNFFCNEQKRNCSENLAYYESIQNELKTVFSKGKKEISLENVVPNSKWVRINYSIDKFYVVGIIEKNSIPQYICYGVPGKFGNPPEKLKEYSSFIPSSVFNLIGDGYFVMFQSAINGERIVPKIDVFGF